MCHIIAQLVITSNGYLVQRRLNPGQLFNKSIVGLAKKFHSGVKCIAKTCHLRCATGSISHLVPFLGLRFRFLSCGGLFCRGCQIDVIDSIFTFSSGYDIQVGDESAGAVLNIDYTLVQGGRDRILKSPGSDLNIGEYAFNGLARYAQGPLGNHYLQVTSDALNAGSDDAVNICFTGADGVVCMDELTTRPYPDHGIVDLGYHYPIARQSNRTLWTKFATTPPSGMLPVNVRCWLLLRQATNPPSTRVAAVNMGLRTAGGQYFQNWRSGELTVSPGQDTLEVWTQVLPNRWSFAGENLFLTRVVDITPPPYNLPPYQASGGSAIDTFTFTGIEP